MTTELQKQAEERFVKKFLDGLIDYTSLNRDEKPDFWIRKDKAAKIGLEVTEYHPKIEGSFGGCPRVEAESRWWKNLEPLLEQERRTRSTLKEVRGRLSFKDPKLPRMKDHAALASELVRLIEVAASYLKSANPEISVDFAARGVIAQLGPFMDDALFLPVEDWPFASKHLNCLTVSLSPVVKWPPFHCQDVATAWIGPHFEELQRILQGKTDSARTYDVADAPLWLLVVCDLFGDLQSHDIFPKKDSAVAPLITGLEQAGFTFQDTPFSEVWLFSVFSGLRRRIHPLEG